MPAKHNAPVITHMHRRIHFGYGPPMRSGAGRSYYTTPIKCSRHEVVLWKANSPFGREAWIIHLGFPKPSSPSYVRKGHRWKVRPDQPVPYTRHQITMHRILAYILTSASVFAVRSVTCNVSTKYVTLSWCDTAYTSFKESIACTWLQQTLKKCNRWVQIEPRT